MDLTRLQSGIALLDRKCLMYLVLVWIICWLTNYLFFQGFGLYYDDLPAIGNHAKKQLWGIESSWEWLKLWPQGRPIGWVSLSALGWPARYFAEPAYVFLIAYVIVASVASLAFLVVRGKYGNLAGLIVSIFYLTCPMDLTRIQPTMNFLAHPALASALFGILLYQKGRRYCSFFVAAVAIVCYESAFLLFVAAPFLTWNAFRLDTWKRIILHAIMCLGVVAVVMYIRYYVFGSGFVVHARQEERDLILAFLHGLWIYGLHFFDFLWFGLLRGYEFLTFLSLVIGFLLLGVLVWTAYGDKTRLAQSPRSTALELLFVGFVMLMLGIFTSGLADYYPYLAITGRNTRVYLAASIGGGMMIAALVIALLQFSQKWHYLLRGLPWLVLLLLVMCLTGNSLKMQEDYVNAWTVQKQTVRDAISLSCDVEPGDVIVLVAKAQVWNKGRAMTPYGFGLSTVLADIYNWEDMPLKEVPRIMSTQEKWFEGLSMTDAGTLKWDRQRLSGFPTLAMEPITPGSIIYLRGTWRGLIRLDGPLVVDGVNILKPPMPPEKCTFDELELTGPLAPFFFPDYFALRSR